MSSTMTTTTTAHTLPSDSNVTFPSHTMIAKSPQKDNLADLGFKRLSDGVSVYMPPTSHTTVSNNDSKGNFSSSSDSIPDPTLLIFCSWAFAQPKHIAKYLAPYQKLYPNTTILLVQNFIGNMIWTPDALQYKYFQAGASVIQAHISSTNTPRVLVHIFSNGGSHAAVQLAETYRETCGGLRMPVDAVILDSCPGIPRARATVNAMVHGVPNGNILLKWTVAAMSWMMVGTTAFLDMSGIAELAASKLYRKLNDPYEVFVFKGAPKPETPRTPVPRSYIYSKTDTMIMEEDVIAHAQLLKEEMEKAIAKWSEYTSDPRAGDIDVDEFVKLEEFDGTAHVNHVKNEPERYWNVVKETWARSQQI